jgi:hypothetical protein
VEAERTRTGRVLGSRMNETETILSELQAADPAGKLERK